MHTLTNTLTKQVVSQVANATGEVVLLPNLNGVQGVAFERPTVVLAQVGCFWWGVIGS